MAILKNSELVFIGEIIEFGNGDIGKIERFILEVYKNYV